MKAVSFILTKEAHGVRHRLASGELFSYLTLSIIISLM